MTRYQLESLPQHTDRSRRILLNVVVPALVTLALILGFFEGGHALRQFIAPDWNREIGFLENLQAALLAIGCVVLARGIVIKREPIERLILSVLFLGTLFMTLEELDYGIHYYAHFTDASYEDFPVRNIHNQGDNTDLMKRAGDIVQLLLFVVAPLALANVRIALLRYLAPSRYFVVSMIIMVLLSRFAHYLDDTGNLGEHALTFGIAEFRELITYYLFLLYYVELVFWKRLRRE